MTKSRSDDRKKSTVFIHEALVKWCFESDDFKIKKLKKVLLHYAGGVTSQLQDYKHNADMAGKCLICIKDKKCHWVKKEKQISGL